MTLFADLPGRFEVAVSTENGFVGHVFRPWTRPDDPGFLDGFDPVPRASLWLARARFLRRLARDPRARGNLADDAAFLAARRLRRAADRLDALFEERRGHWRRP